MSISQPGGCLDTNGIPDARFEPAAPFSEAEINALESSIGWKLPKDYSEFIKQFGGAFVGGCIDGADDLPILAFFGADKDKGILSKLHAYPDLRAEGVLPIADCELGNLYVLDRENAVHYINYYGGKTSVRKVAASFQAFADRIAVQDE
ncbi:SMI1/KNR4 family protein [Massilia aquatica]|uniref:SMI1/KNR4 family protein n=1 Tax=Massilia aquatica TaxID=2609000 RepID=A0ABX0MGM5_9BURK|nr:SMI1/KNR4 family protein [Massilia aquatica]NHZ43560.1 SMI1/KNR4 family protein [Massilia aquatica]